MPVKQIIARKRPLMNPESAPSATLRSRWLLIARALWVAVAALTVGLFVAGIPAEFARLQVMCPTEFCPNGQLPPAGLRALADLGLSLDFFAAYGVALDVVFAVVYGAVAALIFWLKSADRLALFVALALLTFGTATHPLTMEALVVAHPAWQPTVAGLHFLGSASFSLFLYLFPDGRFVPRWTRWVALAWIAWLLPRYWIPNWPSDFAAWSGWLNLVVWPVALGAAVYAQIYRYRRVSNRVQRQQAKWVVFGIAMALTGFLSVNLTVSAVAPMPASAGALATLMVGAALMYLALLLIPLSIGIAMLRYHLFDVDVLINRTLVYGALTASVVGIYVLIVGSLGPLFQTRSNLPISLVATGLVAVLFQPLRDRLQRGVNRLMYGERDDPYSVLSRLGQRLEATLAPDAVLPTIVETVREVFRLPYVAIYMVQDQSAFKIVAESTSPTLRSQGGAWRAPGLESEGLCASLIYQGETVGYIALAPRAPGESFSPADRRLVDDLARQAGVAVHAVRLTADLQRSRERLVATREEERRRIRRDLHDGLGPQLAALNLQAGVLRGLIPRDPAAADALVIELRGEIRAAIADIRRLVYDLRPPTLDELGLVGAVRARAAQCSPSGAVNVEPNFTAPGASGFQVMVEAPEQLPPLPAAVEVAAYRIVEEALTNVVRHAQARTCVIRLALTEAGDHKESPLLRLEITDDGIGLPADYMAGVGFHSMRERAAELGGTCVIEGTPAGGTRVVARLPIGKE